MNPEITAALFENVLKTIQYPNATVCKHYVAANILSLMEKHGVPISKEMAYAVVNGEDEDAEIILKKEIDALAVQS